MDYEKCNDYINQYIDEGNDYAANTFDCTNKLRFRAGDFRLWSVSVYYIIVTLTTCADLSFWRDTFAASDGSGLDDRLFVDVAVAVQAAQTHGMQAPPA